MTNINKVDMNFRNIQINTLQPLHGAHAHQSIHTLFPVKFSYNFHHMMRKLNQPRSHSLKVPHSDVESNFKSIDAAANRFTANVPFISNKKMTLVSKYQYDNGEYETDRVGKYDMKKFANVSPEGQKVYKTTIFRNGQYVQKRSEDLKMQRTLLEQDEMMRKEMINCNSNKKVVRKVINPSKSFYKELTMRKNEVVNKYFKDENTQINFNKKSIGSYKNKNPVEMLQKKKIDHSIPLIFPCCVTYDSDYNSTSEQARCERITNTFLRLKYLISIDAPEKENDYLKVFLIQNDFFENEITFTHLLNFSSFLQQKEIKINPTLSMRDNLIAILNGENVSTSMKSKAAKKYSKSMTDIKRIEDHKIKIDNFNLVKQTKLYKDKFNKEDDAIISNLQKELSEIQEEKTLNKLKVNQPMKVIASTMYITQKKENESYTCVDLRLGNCEEEERKQLLQRPQKEEKKTVKISDLNERLYYSKVESKGEFDFETYKKKMKLTEYIMLEKTKKKKALEEVKQREEERKLRNFLL